MEESSFTPKNIIGCRNPDHKQQVISICYDKSCCYYNHFGLELQCQECQNSESQQEHINKHTYLKVDQQNTPQLTLIKNQNSIYQSIENILKQEIDTKKLIDQVHQLYVDLSIDIQLEINKICKDVKNYIINCDTNLQKQQFFLREELETYNNIYQIESDFQSLQNDSISKDQFLINLNENFQKVSSENQREKLEESLIYINQNCIPQISNALDYQIKKQNILKAINSNTFYEIQSIQSKNLPKELQLQANSDNTVCSDNNNYFIQKFPNHTFSSYEVFQAQEKLDCAKEYSFRLKLKKIDPEDSFVISLQHNEHFDVGIEINLNSNQQQEYIHTSYSENSNNTDDTKIFFKNGQTYLIHVYAYDNIFRIQNMEKDITLEYQAQQSLEDFCKLQIEITTSSNNSWFQIL